MNAANQLSRVTPIVGRLLEDDYVQEQIGQALSGLRQSARQVKGRSANEAIKDRRLRDQLGAAVGSLTEAIRAVKQPPPPRRRPIRRLLAVTAVASAVALAWQKRPPRNVRQS